MCAVRKGGWEGGRKVRSEGGREGGRKVCSKGWREHSRAQCTVTVMKLWMK